MKVFIVLAVALLLPQEKNEAEELFKKMEEKLAKAKTLQVKCSGSADMAVGRMSFESKLVVGEDNRVRLDSELKTPMGDRTFLTVCDGADVWSKKEGESRSNGAGKTLRADLVRSFSRGGGLFAAGWLDVMSEKDSPHPARKNVPQVAGLKLGKKEQVGDREAQAVDITVKGVESGEVHATLWIDCETGLPVKRLIRGPHGQEKMILVETYSDLKLDEKIDAAKFEIPKEAK